ncbi:MAG: YciI-like protein [Bacteroidota bacterium]
MTTYYLLFYRTVEGFIEKRQAHREAHLSWVRQAHENGDFMMGGALDEPDNEAVLLFRGDNPETAKAFAEGDPYVRAGLVTSWEVRPWRVAVGGE